MELKFLGLDLVRIAIAVVKHHDLKQLGEERVHFILHFPITELQEGTQAGTEAETKEECCLLAGSVCSACFCEPPARGQHHLLWAEPSHINKKMPCRLAYSLSYIFSLVVPSSQVLEFEGVFFCFVFFKGRVSLCHPGCPGTHSVKPGWPQVYRDLPGICKACPTTAWL